MASDHLAFLHQLKNRKTVSMVSMRKAIPLLLKTLYNVHECDSQKKVRGMWAARPENYPHNLPFVDPNNATPTAGKPKKQEILPMFNFLIREFRDISAPKDMNTAKLSPLYQPKQIVQERWMRINDKMRKIPNGKNKQFLSNVSATMAKTNHGVIDVKGLLQDQSDFECTLDIYLIYNCLPEEQYARWAEYVATQSPSDHGYCNLTREVAEPGIMIEIGGEEEVCSDNGSIPTTVRDITEQALNAIDDEHTPKLVYNPDEAMEPPQRPSESSDSASTDSYAISEQEQVVMFDSCLAAAASANKANCGYNRVVVKHEGMNEDQVACYHLEREGGSDGAGYSPQQLSDSDASYDGRSVIVEPVEHVELMVGVESGVYITYESHDDMSAL